MGTIGLACSILMSIRRYLKKPYTIWCSCLPHTLLKKKFSYLVELKTQRQNALKFVDSLLRMALEELNYLQFEKLQLL